MKRFQRIGLATAFAMATSAAPLAAQASEHVTCDNEETLTPMRGKIFVNTVEAGVSLGTVHLILGDGIKMKCGIRGQGGLLDGNINFVHTLVCDDQLEPLPGNIVHSQVQLNTRGTANFQTCSSAFPPGAVTGDFQEVSTPIPGSGRGVFTGVERGEIKIKGEVNCFLSSQMQFSGEVCLKTPQ